MRKLGAVVVAAAFGGLVAAACSSGGGGSLSTTAFCDLLRSNQTLGDAGTAASNPAQSASAVASTLDQLAQRAPSDIRADLEKIVDAVRKSVDLTSDFSNSSKSAAVESSLSSLNESTAEAKQHIAQFSKDKCGIDLESPSPSS